MCVLFTCVFHLAPGQTHAQGNNSDVTNGGTEFLLCFMQNEDPQYQENASRYQDIYLAATGDSTTVTITCRAFPHWKHVVQLAPNQALSYRLSTDPVIGFPDQDAIIESSEIIDSTVFKVVSTAPIICYGMNHKTFTCDAFLALPQNVASTEYIVMAYYNSNQPLLSGDLQPSEFCVASFDDADTVTIIPSAVTHTGSPKNKAITFTLDAGECMQIQGDPTDVGGDLTGSIVRSTSPVVVYGGSARTEVPTGFTNIQGGQQTTSRDHLSEAIPPLSTWGKSFITKNFGRPDGDLMRVVASKSNTVIKINGQVWGTPLKAREFRDTLISQSVVMTDNIFAVEASNPILVGMIAHTADVTTQMGDPFLAIVPPLDQTYHDYTFFISDDKTDFDPNFHYVIISTEASGAGTITIDG
ncbi:MAG: IgGFc-binding protein, partial [Candidatus Kapaibacterium sp.]